jgi:dipeptidyl aminopeptidase/acylaminoacyl peptidase
LITADSGERRQLTLPPTANLGDGMPCFSPDGRMLAFARGTSFFVGDIYQVSVAGGPARQLTADNRWLMGLAWTSDGREVVFSSNRGGLLGLWRTRQRAAHRSRCPRPETTLFFPPSHDKGAILLTRVGRLTRTSGA